VESKAWRYAKAIERWKGFYSAHKPAYKFVNELLAGGMLTPEALRRMRWKFADAYLKWKIQKEYPLTRFDEHIKKTLGEK
jgi:hypothetical protein